jgi:hypothetical protein
VSHSLKQLFVDKIRHLPDVEAIYWRESGSRVRVWTIMDEPDLDVENSIYKAELEVMDLLGDLQFDFSVIFRRGKDRKHMSPERATRIFARP